MRLKHLATNKIEICLGDEYDTRVLISYETPVAYRQTLSAGVRYFKTEKKWSQTTTRHINSWVPSGDALVVPQSSLDLLLETLDKPMTGGK